MMVGVCSVGADRLDHLRQFLISLGLATTKSSPRRI
jgi:hypothetical protein